MTSEQFQHIAHTIPHNAGIYKYFNRNKDLIYVGKAKDLRKRVSSYFSKTFTSYKTHELVQRIHTIEFTIVDSEQDAFLLENALIKQFQPKYNINLKDDKTYPFIVVKKEPFSRVYLTRKKINDGSEYLGPFTSAGKVRELLNFIKQFIPLRTCKLNLTEKNIQQHKFKVCLEFHLGNCKGPCEAFQSAQEYTEGLLEVKNILKGNVSGVITQLKKEMLELAAEMKFEKAEVVKKKIEYLENYQAKSVIVSKYLGNIDIFSILKEDDIAYVNYLMVQNGTIVQTHTTQLQTKLEETEEEVLIFAISQLRETFNSLSTEIVLPFEIDYPDHTLIFTVPKAGDKKKLLELSIKNVNYYQTEIRKKRVLHLEGKTDWEKKNVLYELQQYLQLQEAPVHIECFDNSNFHGSYPVSAMVCFKDGLPSTKDYRHYNIKTVTGINDFASMKEVVGRRYERVIQENESLPQLVIIDGGKGQLSAAMESITELGLRGKLTVIGLAKNEEEIFFPGDSHSIKLPWNSDSLKLIRRIRDEVHNYGITFHRNKRSKGTFKNELENIKGISALTANRLLKKYKSVNNVSKLSVDELTETIGKNRAELIWNYFNKTTSGK